MARHEETEGFRVVDRRRFTPEGEPAAPGQPATHDQPAAEPQRAAEPRPSPAPAEPAAGATSRDLPPANFGALVQMLTMSTLDALGAIPGPDGKPLPPDLPLARHGIDLLAVLEAKTRGNLTPDEVRLLEQALFDLRMLAVRVARSGT